MSWLRQSVKRIGFVLLALLAALGMTAYLLVGYRPSIAPAPPHPRAAPAFSALPRFTVCWVESGAAGLHTPFAATASALLVRHPAGDVLIDTGNSSHFEEEIRGYPFGARLWLEALPGSLKPRALLPDLLRRAGADPAALRWVVLSHAHLDHAGGLMDLPRVPVLMPPQEMDFVGTPVGQQSFFVMPAHAKRLLDGRTSPLVFERRPYETFDESADLFGDSSVVIVPLSGHTPGSIGVFVNLSSRRRLFHVGDAVDDSQGFEERVGKTLILRRTDFDPPRANEVVAKLGQLHELVPSLTILPAHDRRAYQRFFPGGPMSCAGPE